MNSLDYWKECISEALSEQGIAATAEQIHEIAYCVEGAHENYGMAFYQPENPLIGELANAKSELKKEQDKVFCKPCNGSGRIYTQGPYHGSDSQCWKCHGHGKHAP